MSNLTAFVTGATRGIGRGIALSLAQAGYDVAFCYRNKAVADELVSELNELGVQALAIEGNLDDISAIPSMFDTFATKFDTLDLLVNCAGLTRDNLLVSTSDEDLLTVIQVNLVATMVCSREALKLMLPKKRGNIVNISSISAHKANPGQASYAASKGGVESFTKALAVEVGRKKVRVNCIAPGVIETDMVQDLLADRGGDLKKKVLTKRFGQPSDIAKAVLYLADPENEFVTGQIIEVNGGMMLV